MSQHANPHELRKAAACFALLDDATATATDKRSRLYTGYVRSVICRDPENLDAAWALVQAALAGGLHAVILADYEWGVRLQGVQPRSAGASAPGVCRVLLFRRLRHCSSRAVERWLARVDGQANPGAVGVLGMTPDIDETAFSAAVGKIHAAIADGETYQVNFTYRLNGQVGGDPVALYRRLRARQPVAYGALIRLPEGEAVTHVLSLSPELFLRHEAGRLTARPMKGTAPRHGDQARDLLAREELATAKSRAENLMIVDLLRNDLGRIARIGSVQVPALFEIEAHATVWQMTSTISAELAPGRHFPDVLRALFPCGSITGAPKHRTLSLIDALEQTPRGLYCGAIGWVGPSKSGTGLPDCPDFCLSVPIRTLLLGASDQGWRPVQLGIGAGIVADSQVTQEMAECRLKARFLTEMEPGFALIETMLVEAGSVRHLARHLARQEASAKALGLASALDDIATVVTTAAARFSGEGALRLRLLRFPDGRCSVTLSALDPLPAGPVPLLLDDQVFDDSAWPLAHKTTLRAPYDRALARASALGAFDIIHVNRRRELTEGARSNLFLRIDGEWLTPALACGVLPGVMRSVLLDDSCWQAREAVLYADHLHRAEEIIVCNALRGALPALLRY